jgi:hypothetical protein
MFPHALHRHSQLLRTCMNVYKPHKTSTNHVKLLWSYFATLRTTSQHFKSLRLLYTYCTNLWTHAAHLPHVHTSHIEHHWTWGDKTMWFLGHVTMFSIFPWYIGTIGQVPLRCYHSTCFPSHHFSFILWFRYFFIVFYLASCSPHVIFSFWYYFFKTYITLYYLLIPIRKRLSSPLIYRLI